VENANLPDYTMQNSIKTRAYAGNKIFEDGSLNKILLPNGYIQNNIYYFYLRDHLGNNCVTAKADGTVMQGLQYYPYGKVNEDESMGISFQPYKYGGKEDEPMHGLGLYDSGARSLNHKGVPYTLTPDPLQEKYYSISPYAWCLNNPVRYTDPGGDTIVVDNIGSITRNDKTDNLVYMSDGENNEFLGELGKTIDINKIYTNLLNKSSKEAESIWNPITFRNKVKTKGEWDLKNNKNTIYGLANDGKTRFSFQKKEMEAQDVGNHHFGVVAKASGIFSENFILEQAGEYQIKSGTSKLEWQIYTTERIPTFTKTGRLIWLDKRVMLPPYGDDPRDQMWIKAGFDYYKNRRK
jgi:RHS repeat-associated protein